MNVLVTVGTTSFDALFKVLDQPQIVAGHEFKAQIGPGSYAPKHMSYFTFSDCIQAQIDWADLVICHAGAGTVFDLLEQGKKCLVVANLERADKHQRELMTFVVSERFALGTDDLDEVSSMLVKALEFKPANYVKSPFFIGDNLSDLILSYYN